MVSEFYIRHNNTRTQINKFHVLIEIIPPSLIVQFANIIQEPSPNPYDDLKAAILQHTQQSATERIEKLLQQEWVGELRLTALLNGMKLLAPGESFFWKLLYFKKLPSYTQPVLVNALKTKIKPMNHWLKWQTM
ncbi:unnamed protein product [Hymenolepis diminuta]|uniref:DUF7041 domain-containing protein n=1 Tax=Hymenolepis diminuta TaxID=6216 RepID=A0A564YHQ0_HYMDI|nr:unnamed protein product [Hymenolepis diminuta]